MCTRSASETVRRPLTRSHRLSATRQFASLGISDHSMTTILHKDLNFNLYKTIVVQELSNSDKASCSKVAGNLIRILSDHIIVFITEEAHLHSSGCVNKQNFCCRTEENPQQLHQRPLHRARTAGAERQTSESGAPISLQTNVDTMNEYNNPSFATMFQCALLNTCITTCFGLNDGLDLSRNML
jgi:hypothetical protein